MTEIVINLDRGPDDQPAGLLRKESGQTVRFIGWLDLIRVLEDEFRAIRPAAVAAPSAANPSSADQGSALVPVRPAPGTLDASGRAPWTGSGAHHWKGSTMLKHHRLLAIAGTVATAGAIAVSSLTAASARPAAAGPAVSRTEHVRLISTSFSSNRESIIGTGAFTFGGVDHEGKGNVDRVVAPGGTFKIRHSAGKGTQKVNPKTCLLTVSEHGTYKLFAGTGRFTGLGGHGRYHLSIVAVARRSKGKCSMSKAPSAAQTIITASGPAHL